ncbi:Ankyrin repeat domain-containing protein 42 [Schistosoma japonicum]|nr:Ankyrin repeat domain-containing protein 42 [Schistosoma japonicum]KAH8854636.1 Ankyrin repeat domain-containing protein 42 [Schistosoma japonicum]
MTIAKCNERVTIHYVVERSDFTALKEMISSGANVNEVDQQSFTPLHWAANVGAIEILQYLLWKNADPMLVTKNGWTPVHIAAIRGYEKCIQSLIDRGISVSVQDKYGQTPGHMASIHGNSRSLVALLRGGADIKTVDVNGWTLLHAAAFHGRLGCVQVLLKWDLQIEDTDKTGNTAVHLAAMEGHLPVLQCLMSQVQIPLHILNIPNDHGETAETLAKRFLKYDAETYITKIKTGQTFHRGSEFSELLAFPAHAAAYSGNLIQLRNIIESGAVKINERDEQGSTPLHKAAGQGHLMIIQWLRANGADPKLCNILGESPADVARRYGQLGALKLLSPSSDGECEDDENFGIDLPSDIPFGYTEGEKIPQCLVDRNGTLGRAKNRIDKLQHMLDLAKSDYKQLGGPRDEQEKERITVLQEVGRQIEELKATLECERMYREQLEMRLDESSREVATLTMLLNEGRLTLKSKVQQHLDHQNTEKTNKFI